MTERVPVSVLCPYFSPVSVYRASPQTSVGPGIRQRPPRVPVGLRGSPVVTLPPGKTAPRARGPESRWYWYHRISLDLGRNLAALSLQIIEAVTRDRFRS